MLSLKIGGINVNTLYIKLLVFGVGSGPVANEGEFLPGQVGCFLWYNYLVWADSKKRHSTVNAKTVYTVHRPAGDKTYSQWNYDL